MYNNLPKYKIICNKVLPKNNYPKDSAINKFHSNRYKKCKRKVRQTKKLNFPRKSNPKRLKQMKIRNKQNQSIPKM